MKPSHWGGRAKERVRYSRGRGRGKKRRIAWEHSEGKKWITMQRWVDWSRGILGKSGSVAWKRPVSFPPHHIMPERLKTKERRNNFRWILTECDLLPWKRREKMYFTLVPTAAMWQQYRWCKSLVSNKLHPSPLLQLQCTAQAQQQSQLCTQCMQKPTGSLSMWVEAF